MNMKRFFAPLRRTWCRCRSTTTGIRRADKTNNPNRPPPPRAPGGATSFSTSVEHFSAPLGDHALSFSLPYHCLSHRLSLTWPRPPSPPQIITMNLKISMASLATGTVRPPPPPASHPAPSRPSQPCCAVASARCPWLPLPLPLPLPPSTGRVPRRALRDEPPERVGGGRRLDRPPTLAALRPTTARRQVLAQQWQ